MMLLKAEREMDIDQIFEKMENEKILKWFNSSKHKPPKHPLREILDETDAYILGKMLDMFHIYRTNKWQIDKAIRDRSIDDLPKGFNPKVFLNLIVYNKMQNPKYLKDMCPERFKDVLNE